jgi:hypothetical protein
MREKFDENALRLAALAERQRQNPRETLREAVAWVNELMRAFAVLREHEPPFRIYPNPMRSDGVFVGQGREVEPYAGARGLNGPLYPATPRGAFVLSPQVPRDMADALLLMLNCERRGET